MRQEIRSHTGLRGIAATLVVLYHLQFGAFYKFPFENATMLFKRSYLMVDLFFVLSGFILCFVYNADKRLNPDQRRAFWLARFARIYPLHVTVLLYLTIFEISTVALLAFTGRNHDSLGTFWDWLSQVLLINAWFKLGNRWNIPSWSISAECFAYALFPFMIGVRVSYRSLFVVLVTGIVVAFYAIVITTTGNLDITEIYAPFRCMAGFCLGILLFSWRHIISNLNTLSLSAMQIVSSAFIFIFLMIKVSDPMIIPAFAVLVLSTWEDRGVIAAALASKQLRQLGLLSYSIYLTHVPVSDTLGFFWWKIEPKLSLAPPTSRIIWLSIFFATICAVSTSTYKYIERPAQRAIRGRDGPKKEMASVPAP